MRKKTLRQEMAEMDAQEADKRRRAREIEWAIRDEFIRAAAVRSDAAKRGWMTRRQRQGGMTMAPTQAGYVVTDTEGAIHGIGDTENAAWADMQRNFDTAGITLLPDGADSTDELGSWTREGNLKTLPASARVLAAVEAGGGNIAWSVVGGIACTPDEADS